MEIDDKKLSWCFEATDRIRIRLSQAVQYPELVNTRAHPCDVRLEEEERLVQEFWGEVGKVGWQGEPVDRVV